MSESIGISHGTAFASDKRKAVPDLTYKEPNMLKHKHVITLLIASLILWPLAGCDSLPGDKKTQGTVIGGVGGAVAGGALAKNNRLLGALIGGALGAGGGYLIGSSLDKSDPKKNRDD